MNTENELNFFTNRPPFELVDNEEMRMAQDERIVTQTIGPRTTHTEISRILQQKIYMERENLEKFSLGILNILLNTDNPGKFQQFFQSLQFLTQDGFESTILKLESIVYLKFQSLKIESATNLLKIVHNFIKLRLPKVDTLIMLCLRQIVIEDFSEKMQQYTRLFLSILTEESDWLISNFNNANIALVFAKLLRIFSFALCAEISAYKTMILKLLNSIWVTKKEACLMLGRELIRLMMEIFKAKEIEFITNDLKNSHPSLDIPLSEYLLKNKGEVLSLPDITKMMIPPYLEELLRYLHYYTPTENMPRMMKWIIRDFRIQSGIMNEFLMVDITRFLVASVHPDSNTIRSGFAPRWKTIAFMLQVAKNDLARSFIKQNIFYDWIFYNPKETNIMLIEPGISIIKGTYYENLPLCHELLDFLFISCKEYNPKNAVETKASIRAAFGEGLRQGVTETFDDLMYSEALDYSLREKMTTFIPSEKNYEAGLTGLTDFQESQPTSTLNHVPENTFKPESIEEEYDPFEEFSPSKFDENMFKNIGLHEYDPDSSATGVLNSDTGIGGMEVESIADKPVESQSFNEKFKGMIQKMTENPDKANFEKFLKEFIHYVQSGQGDEDKYLKFAETLSNCYDDHFEDVLFTIEHNIIKILLQHVIETLHTVVATYNLLKHILRGLYKIRSTVSFQYLIFYYRIVQSTERAFLEDYIILIGGERNFEPQLSEDISRLYAIYSQAEFNELLIKILKDFCNYIIGRPPLLKTIIEIGDVSLNFWLEEELTCCTLRLFPDKIKELVLNSTRWSVSSQESFWGLLTNQYNLSRKKEASDLIVDIRDVVNEICKDPDFDKNSVYGILKGFRRFFNDTLQNKDDKTKLDYMVLMIDLHQNVSFFLHSLFNLWDPHLIRVSLKEYAKRNGEEPEKIRNLGYHMLYMRSKRYYLKNQESIMETHLKSVLTRLFQKHKLEKEFKDIIED